MARKIQITFDCGDPAALSGFWAEALGYRLQDAPEGFESWEAALESMGIPPERRNDASALIDPNGTGPRLFFQRVPEGKTAKNRVHIDIREAPELQVTSGWPLSNSPARDCSRSARRGLRGSSLRRRSSGATS